MSSNIAARKSSNAVNKRKKNPSLNYFFKNKEYYFMLLPGLLLIILFRFVPLYGIQIAFKNFNFLKGYSNSPWVGLQWFKIIFTSPDFFKILRNTLSISFLELLFAFPAPIILALMLNEIKNQRFKKLVQSISYLPHFLSWVIVGGLIIQLLSPSSGPIRFVFEAFGIEPYSLLLKEKWFYPLLIIGEIWKSIGWGTILYLAALAGIDTEQYEAARVDGAGRWRMMWNITLPGMSFIIVMMLVLNIGNIMNVGFEKIYVLGFRNEAVREVAEVFSTYNFRIGIGQQRYSFATAIGLFESVVNFLLVLTANSVTKKLGHGGVF